LLSQQTRALVGEDLVEKQNADVGLLPLVADETHHYGYQEENRHMTAAFAQGRAPAETLDDGLHVTELLMTCYLSAELGETLRFPVSGIDDDVQRGQWSPEALVDAAKLRGIGDQPRRQGKALGGIVR